jgi:hypothetical protein
MAFEIVSSFNLLFLMKIKQSHSQLIKKSEHKLILSNDKRKTKQ